MGKLISLKSIWEDNTSLAYMAYYISNNSTTLTVKTRSNSFPSESVAKNHKYYTESEANNADFLANFQSLTTAYGLKSLDTNKTSTTKLITSDVLQQGNLNILLSNINSPLSQSSYFYPTYSASYTGISWGDYMQDYVSPYLLYNNSYLFDRIKSSTPSAYDMYTLQQTTHYAFLHIGAWHKSIKNGGSTDIYVDAEECHSLSETVLINSFSNPQYYYLVIVPYYNRNGLSNGVQMGHYGGYSTVSLLKSRYQTSNNYHFANLTGVTSSLISDIQTIVEDNLSIRATEYSGGPNYLEIFYEVKLCTSNQIKYPSSGSWYHLATASEPYGFCPFNYYTSSVKLSQHHSSGYGASIVSNPWPAYAYQPTWYYNTYHPIINGQIVSGIEFIKDEINDEFGYNICSEAYFLCDMVSKETLSSCNSSGDNVAKYFVGLMGNRYASPSSWSSVSDVSGLTCFYKTIIMPIAIKYNATTTLPTEINYWRYGRQVKNNTPEYMPLYRGVTYLTTLAPGETYNYTL